MSSQIAKLFIRGRIQYTSKNLTSDELQKVSDLMHSVWNTSEMKNSIYEFSQALGRTIGNEYKDIKFGLEEVWIAFWQTAVNVLYHRPKKDIRNIFNSTCTKCKHIDTSAIGSCPKCKGSKYDKPASFIEKSIGEMEHEFKQITGIEAPKRDTSIIDSKISRNKFFKTCLFNYLKQILRENRITTNKEYVSIINTADVICHKLLTSILANNKIKYQSSYNINRIDVQADISMLSSDAIMAIGALAEQMATHNVDMIIEDNTISIIKTQHTPIITASILEKTRTQDINFQVENENGDQDTIEDHIKYQNDTEQEIVDYSDTLMTIRQRLTPDSQKIFDILTNSPDEFVQKYGQSTKKTNIAEYLGIQMSDVELGFEHIRLQMQAVSLLPN